MYLLSLSINSFFLFIRMSMSVYSIFLFTPPYLSFFLSFPLFVFLSTLSLSINSFSLSVPLSFFFLLSPYLTTLSVCPLLSLSFFILSPYLSILFFVYSSICLPLHNPPTCTIFLRISTCTYLTHGHHCRSGTFTKATQGTPIYMCRSSAS